MLLDLRLRLSYTIHAAYGVTWGPPVCADFPKLKPSTKYGQLPMMTINEITQVAQSEANDVAPNFGSECWGPLG